MEPRPDRIICRVRLDGEPAPKGRPRFGRHGAYTPARTVGYELRLGWELRRACPEPVEGPVGVSIALRVTSATADIDNLLKAVLDSANAIVWRDDRQVREAWVTLERGSVAPGVEFTAYRLEGE